MMNWDWRRFVDLTVLLVIEFLFTSLYFLRVEIGLLSFVLGMVHLGFIPGYFLTFILFPSNRDPEDNEDEEEDDERKKGEDKKDPGFHRRRALILSKTEEKKVDEKKTTDQIEREIGWPVRIALSIGLSLGFSSVISWVFNYLYQFNSDIFGLRIDTITAVSFLIIGMLFILAVRRRYKLSDKEAERFKMESFHLFEKDRKDRIITSILIGGIVLSLITGIYLHYFQIKDHETYTQFFFLTEQEDISEFDRLILVNETQTIKLGLINNERRDMDFHVEVSLDGIGDPVEVDTLQGIDLDRESKYRMDFEVDRDKPWRATMSYNIPLEGRFLLQANLFHDGELYRQIYLDMTVVDPENYIVSQEMEVEGYLARTIGEPRDIQRTLLSDNVLEMGLVLRNTGNISHYYNITINSGGVNTWVNTANSSRTYNFFPGYGFFVETTIEPKGTRYYGFSLRFPPGEWEIRLTFSNNSTIGFDRTILVY